MLHYFATWAKWIHYPSDMATNFYGGSNEAFYFDVVQNRLKISYSFPVQVNGTYQRVMVANENFDKVMVQVNQWILDGIKKGAASSIITLG